MVRSNIFGPYFFEPLNIMCSKKCDRPVMPGASLREPTFQNVYIVAFGMEVLSRTMNFMPFGRVKVFTSSAVTACAAEATPSRRVAARAFHFMVILSGLIRKSIAKDTECGGVWIGGERRRLKPLSTTYIYAYSARAACHS